MPLVLSVREQKRLVATTRILLAPFDTPIEEWRADVLDNLTELLGADAGGFMFPVGDGLPYALRNLPDDFAREYIETYAEIDESTPMIRALGSGAWSTRTLLELTAGSKAEYLQHAQVYNDFYCRFGIRDAVGFAIATDSGTREAEGAHAPPPAAGPALLTCFRDRFGTVEFGERGLAILRLLAPALESGVVGRMHLNAARGPLESAFDVAREGMLLCDADGRRVHTNAALGEILQNDPEAERISAAIDQAARRGRHLTSMVDGGNALAEMHAASSDLNTALGRYCIRAYLVDGERREPGRVVLVTVERAWRELPSLLQLQAWWGLTPQEARVALLIARGMTNSRVAAALRLSASTARHYTEAVFVKLSVSSRAEASHRILSH